MVRGSIAKTWGVGLVVAAVLLAATLVGEAFAGGGGITEPQLLDLVTTGCSTNDDDPATDCEVYRLKDTDGNRSGEIVRFKVPVWDLDGTEVGKATSDCVSVKAAGQLCTLVLTLKAGPQTEAGTIVATGTDLPPSAITGGSGAYLNVRGDITGEDQADGFHLFLDLIP